MPLVEAASKLQLSDLLCCLLLVAIACCAGGPGCKALDELAAQGLQGDGGTCCMAAQPSSSSKTSRCVVVFGSHMSLHSMLSLCTLSATTSRCCAGILAAFGVRWESLDVTLLVSHGRHTASGLSWEGYTMEHVTNTPVTPTNHPMVILYCSWF